MRNIKIQRFKKMTVAVKLQLVIQCLIVFMILAPGTVYADMDSGAWIMSAGTLGTYDTQATAGGTLSGISAELGIGHSIGSSLELLLLGTYISSAATGSSPVSLIEGAAEILYVLAGGHSDAFYVGPKVGIDSVNNGVTSSSNFYGGVLGKRFSLGGAISYDPNIAVTASSDSSGISSPKFHFVPLQFTLIF